MGASLRQQRATDPDQPRPVGDGTTRDHVGEGPDYPIYLCTATYGSGAVMALTLRRAGASTRLNNLRMDEAHFVAGVGITPDNSVCRQPAPGGKSATAAPVWGSGWRSSRPVPEAAG